MAYGSSARSPVRSPRDRTVDAAVATLVLSHVDDPVGALSELGRVTRAGGPVGATAFPYGVGHRVKEIADQVLAEAGYRAPGWYTTLKTSGEQRVGTAANLVALAAAAGLRQPRWHRCDVDLTGLPVDALVAWRDSAWLRWRRGSPLRTARPSGRASPPRSPPALTRPARSPYSY